MTIPPTPLAGQSLAGDEPFSPDTLRIIHSVASLRTAGKEIMLKASENPNTTMSRTITDHKATGLNEAITITAKDEPGPGGANHEYVIWFESVRLREIEKALASITPESKTDPITLVRERTAIQRSNKTVINFQNGPIASPAGFNGITNEALLAVLIDRMRGFQYARNPDGSFDSNTPGKFACYANATALLHLEAALDALKNRTKERIARNVEGTLTP